MIVDCHTHIWASADQLGRGGEQFIRRQSGQARVAAGPADHALAAECIDKSLVMAFRSVDLDAEVPNEFVAEYVARHGDKMVGIAAIDPAEDGASERAEELLKQDEFRGLTISPAMQNLHPADSRAMGVYDLAARLGAPVFFWQSTHFPPTGRMEYARPSLLDEIALEYPELVMVISSLGHPWIEEGIALLGKHPRLFGDISGLVHRPWQAYNALVLAHQFNVMDKVLFGSDFPYSTPAAAIKCVYRLHEVTQGTNLPSVPREALRGMVERNALTALGIARPGEVPVEPAGDEGEGEEAL
ncbi:MAG TPA: amidohydrolase family protein [Phycisphaerae bacterium]|nr:amidohydrolase family protein [Phycisphaerae bacterium]